MASKEDILDRKLEASHIGKQRSETYRNRFLTVVKSFHRLLKHLLNQGHTRCETSQYLSVAKLVSTGLETKDPLRHLEIDSPVPSVVLKGRQDSTLELIAAGSDDSVNSRGIDLLAKLTCGNL